MPLLAYTIVCTTALSALATRPGGCFGDVEVIGQLSTDNDLAHPLVYGTVCSSHEDCAGAGCFYCSADLGVCTYCYECPMYNDPISGECPEYYTDTCDGPYQSHEVVDSTGQCDDVQWPEEVATYNQCAALCDQTVDCRIFSFDESSGQCFLHKGGRPSADPGGGGDVGVCAKGGCRHHDDCVRPYHYCISSYVCVECNGACSSYMDSVNGICPSCLPTTTDLQLSTLLDPFDMDNDGDLDLVGYSKLRPSLGSVGNFMWYELELVNESSVPTPMSMPMPAVRWTKHVDGVVPLMDASVYRNGIDLLVTRIAFLRRRNHSGVPPDVHSGVPPDVLVGHPPLQYEYDADVGAHTFRMIYDSTYDEKIDWIHTEDFNGDGFDDLVQLKLSGNNHLVKLLRGGADGALTPQQSIAWTYPDVAGDSCHACGTSDLSGDGFPDLVVSCRNHVHWYEFDPIDFRLLERTFIVEELDMTLSSAERFELSMDLINNDGTVDILLHDRYLLNREGSNGTEWDTEFIPILDNFSQDHGTRLADVNNDGYPDIVAVTFSPATLLWIQNFNGVGFSSNPEIIFQYEDTNALASKFYVVDLDNDGLVDFTWNEFPDIYVMFNGYCPTPSPTNAPTPSPTSQPTHSPTPSPIDTPSSVPTPSPSSEPTTTPSAEPTRVDSEANVNAPMDSDTNRDMSITIAVVLSFVGTLTCLALSRKCVPQLSATRKHSSPEKIGDSQSVDDDSLSKEDDSAMAITKLKAGTPAAAAGVVRPDAAEEPMENSLTTTRHNAPHEAAKPSAPPGDDEGAKPSAPASDEAAKPSAPAIELGDRKPEKAGDGIYRPDLGEVAFMDVYDGVNVDLTTDNDATEMETESSVQIYDHADNIVFSNSEDEDSYHDYHTD